MKLYIKPPSPYLIFFNLKQQGEKTEHFQVEEATMEEVKNFVVTTINQSPEVPKIANGSRCVIEWREYKDGENGKTQSVAVFGITPGKAKEILLKNL